MKIQLIADSSNDFIRTVKVQSEVTGLSHVFI